MPPRLVALDLDGTLLDDASELPAGHERTVRELIGLGVHVAIVTGRPLLTTRWVHAQLGLATPAVCFNGGWVGGMDGATLAHAPLPEADVRAVVAELGEDDGAICCYPGADEWIMDRETRHTRRWREFYRAPIAVDRARIADWRGPSCKLMFVAEPGLLARVAARVRARFAGHLHVVVSQPDRFEVCPAGITKAWGLERLAAHLGVARERVWAVGDADNDREMIAWAGHGCAMGHAPAAVRALARHVLPGIAARGLCALPALLEREGA